MAAAKINLNIPHVVLDLTNEKDCLASSSLTSNREDAIIKLRKDIKKITEENQQVFTPELHYGCRF